MEADRKVNLKSYAWLTALAMLLALFVPLASAGAQDTGPDGDTLSAQAVAEEGGTLDATPESDTNMVDETHTLHAAVADDDATDENFEVRAEVDETGINNASYAGGLPAGAAEECTTDDPGADHGDHCDLAFNEGRTTAEAGDDAPYAAPSSGKDRIRVYHDVDGDDQWDENEDFDFVTKTWVTEEDAADAERLGDTNRITTAVEISRDHWLNANGTSPADTDDDPSNDETFSPREQAEHVVIARADLFPDSLAGTPFATLVEGPQLLTFPQTLEEETENELQRVINPDDDATTVEVYILGETDAISQSVENEIESLGYTVERLGGPDRFDTAIEIAKKIKSIQGTLDHIFITRSHEFPDALAGGAAAANVDPANENVGAIVLNPDGFKEEDTQTFINNNEETATTYALAGPTFNPYACESEPARTKVECDSAAHADITIYGADRYETARALAEFFFAGPTQVGVARGDKFPDALTGGAHIAQFNGPIVLTPTEFLEHDDTRRYLCYTADTIAHAYVYGEFEAVADSTFQEVDDAIDGTDCPAYDVPGPLVHAD